MSALRSIRVRLTLWYIVLLAIILAAFSVGIYVTLRHSLYANLDDSLEVRAEELLPAIRFQGDLPTLAEVVPSDGPPDGEQFVRVFDASGAITFDTGAPSQAPIGRETLQSALDGSTATRSLDASNGTFRSQLTAIRRDSEVLGVLEVARSEDDLSDTLSTLLLILGIAYPVTLVVASAGGVFIASRALAPVDKLTRVAQRISAEDLSQRLDLNLPDDELGRLARTFDDMLARLDTSFHQQRQFTADASHELRTPLTAIKGQVEVALSKDRSPGDYREVLQSVNAESDRLIRLVGSLLTLARADTGRLALTLESVNVAELVEGAVEHVRPSTVDRGLDLQLAPGERTQIRADEGLLLQLLLNLLDNATKYTPSGGRISIGWVATESQVTISVQDDGPGIAPEHLPHVFDRFYRVDTARSRAEGGVGLGLSISKWIAEAHGGTVSAESVLGQGTTFTVTLPRTPASFERKPRQTGS